MRFVCLGYIDQQKWASIPETERNASMDACFAYDDELRKGAHFAAGEALDRASNAVTIRAQNGKVTMTGGPYAETREQLGGILILEARDIDHAIQLISKHPGVRMGPFEIRPVVDLSEMVAQSEKRRLGEGVAQTA
jgi:hypothetical protein